MAGTTKKEETTQDGTEQTAELTRLNALVLQLQSQLQTETDQHVKDKTELQAKVDELQGKLDAVKELPVLPERHVALPVDIDPELMTHGSDDQSSAWNDTNSPHRQARASVLNNIITVLVERAVETVADRLLK